jgi:hypothetical protein
VPTVITAHRMAFSISTTQTVLWDQIQYSGAPAGFAWVLPVKPGAMIQLSHDEWLASLDAATQTVIQSPPSNCAPPVDQDTDNGGGGCGASSESAASAGFSAADAGAEGPSPVTVVSQQVVGPYDAVTVQASQGEALGAWLHANGYDVAASEQPLIDAFTAEGFDFIALKLAPGEGVQAMQPVRVVMPGASLSLPLRMIAAGAGANVGIELWVLGEGVYQAQNFPAATVDFSKVLWDPNAELSNYTTLAASALAANGGRGWLTEMAQSVDQLGNSGTPALAQAYQSSCVPQMLPAMSCDDAGAGDGGAACPPTLVPCDDLDVAMTGIDPASFTVTRLRANLPASALTADLVLGAAASQDPVPNFHVASGYTIPNYNPCGSSGNGASPKSSSACSTSPRPGTRYVDALLGLGVALGIAWGARRRGRKP